MKSEESEKTEEIFMILKNSSRKMNNTKTTQKTINEIKMRKAKI